MSKRIFVLLLVLMSVSLIGIIFIQYFFILKNYEENNKQFSINVNYVLEETTSDVERNEFRKIKEFDNNWEKAWGGDLGTPLIIISADYTSLILHPLCS